MKSTKKSLVASGLSLLTCAALLIGTTFAWFTDSVSNTGNRIQAGTLDITASVAAVDPDGTGFTVKNDTTGEMVNGGNPFGFGTPQSLADENTPPIINEENWEPGQSNAKLLTVTNNGSLAAEIKLDFSVKDAGLEDALWFDFIQVEGGTASGTFTKRPMNTLAAYAGGIELPLLNTGDTLQFILVYGMYEDAGNEYQAKGFEADVTIYAKQTPKEQDGFGNSDYDENAEYDKITVSAGDDLVSVFKNAPDGAVVTLEDGMTLSGAEDIVIDGQKNIKLNLDGNTLNIEKSGSKPIDIAEGSSLTIVGYGGTIQTSAATYCIENNGQLILDSVTINGTKNSAIHNYGTLSVKNSEINGNFAGINNYNGTIETIANSTIKATGSGVTAIKCAGTSVIKEIKDSTITAVSTGSLAVSALSGSASNNVRVERIENSAFDGGIKNADITVVSGTFVNTGIEESAFQKLLAEGSVLTVKDGVYTVAAGE